MNTVTWEGVTQGETLHEAEASLRHRLADAAKAYDWAGVLAILSERPELVNATRPGGQSCYTVLHQAAHGSAPAEVIEQFITLGAWRTLRTAKGEQAVDIALRKGHIQSVPLLTPAFKREVADDVLQAIQNHFHTVIRERMAEGNLTIELRLPELAPLLELTQPAMWFPVPGMYGGFSYHLTTVATDLVLISESWVRVVGGSGQRHLISPFGSLLLAEGFV